MLKWLLNPEYYRIDKEYHKNNNENLVRISEYRRYVCKIAGKPYPCNLIKFDYLKSGYINVQGKIRFSLRCM